MIRALQKTPWALDVLRRVWRFARPRYTAGCVGILFDDQNRVLVVEHAFHTPPVWGLPGGYLDRRENPDSAVARELREELKLHVEVGPVILVERHFGNHLDFAYLCRTTDTIGKLSPELVSYRWAAVDDLPDLRPFHRRAIDRAVNLKSKIVWM